MGDESSQQYWRRLRVPGAGQVPLYQSPGISRSGGAARLQYDIPWTQDRTQGLPKGAN